MSCNIVLVLVSINAPFSISPKPPLITEKLAFTVKRDIRGLVSISDKGYNIIKELKNDSEGDAWKSYPI
jgi:hypothetical protein